MGGETHKPHVRGLMQLLGHVFLAVANLLLLLSTQILSNFLNFFVQAFHLTLSPTTVKVKAKQKFG